MRSSWIRPQQVCAGGSRAVVRLSVTCWRFSSWSAGLSACRDVLLVTGERGARGGYFRKVNGFSILSHTEQTGDHATNDVPERRSSKGAAEQQPLSTAPPQLSSVALQVLGPHMRGPAGCLSGFGSSTCLAHLSRAPAALPRGGRNKWERDRQVESTCFSYLEESRWKTGGLTEDLPGFSSTFLLLFFFLISPEVHKRIGVSNHPKILKPKWADKSAITQT